MRGRRRVPFSASHRGVSQKRLEKGAEAKARAEKVKEDFFYENYQKTFGGNLKRRMIVSLASCSSLQAVPRESPARLAILLPLRAAGRARPEEAPNFGTTS